MACAFQETDPILNTLGDHTQKKERDSIAQGAAVPFIEGWITWLEAEHTGVHSDLLSWSALAWGGRSDRVSLWFQALLPG
jgi:hypothetical protein